MRTLAVDEYMRSSRDLRLRSGFPRRSGVDVGLARWCQKKPPPHVATNGRRMTREEVRGWRQGGEIDTEARVDDSVGLIDLAPECPDPPPPEPISVFVLHNYRALDSPKPFFRDEPQFVLVGIGVDNYDQVCHVQPSFVRRIVVEKDESWMVTHYLTQEGNMEEV